MLMRPLCITSATQVGELWSWIHEDLQPLRLTFHTHTQAHARTQTFLICNMECEMFEDLLAMKCKMNGLVILQGLQAYQNLVVGSGNSRRI